MIPSLTCRDPELRSRGLQYNKDVYIGENAWIDAAVEPYPNRWTHHVMIGGEREIDGELLSWIGEAADFADRKQRTS